MSRGRLLSVLSHLQRSLGQGEGLSDAELLERFVRRRDEAAFELLVWRHQDMVFGVCRRLLRDEHDAEDTFQAAFLTLARKAASIGWGEAVAGWLYRVAYRCALRLREKVLRQRQGIVSDFDPAGVPRDDPSLAAVEDGDVQEVLAEEVQRLPARYRAPVVLCYLEGKSYQQAASELGCPAGTLSARLHQARGRLRARLHARGIAAPAAGLTLLAGAKGVRAARLAALAMQAARLGVTRETAAGVSSRVLEVAMGVMQAMSASKQTIIVAMLLLGCLCGVTSWAVLWAWPQAPKDNAAGKADGPALKKREDSSAAWQECARLRGALGRSSRIAFAPDGGTLAVFDGEDRLRAWNTSDWRPRWEFRCGDRYGKHLKYFTSFSPDGRLLDVVGEVADEKDRGRLKGEVTLLEAASGRELARLPGNALIYSPDNTMVATCDKEGVTLWDVRTFRKLRKIDQPASWLVFSRDASLLCIRVRGGCGLWLTATGKKRAYVEGFDPQISPDGKTVSTILPGGVVKLWDTANGRERATIRKEGRTGCHASFSANGKRLLVRAYMELTPDGRHAALVRDGKPRQPPPVRIRPIDVCLHDAATGVEVQRLPGASSYHVHAELSPDGRTVAYSRLEPDETEREEVVLWDVAAGRERAVLRGPSAPPDSRMPSGVHNPFFSADGSTLVTTDPFGKNPRLWEVATGRTTLDLPSESGFVRLSPNGQWLATAPALHLPYQGPYDIRVFRRSQRSLPPPVIRGVATKPPEPRPDSPPPKPAQSQARRAFESVRQEAEHYDEEALGKLRAAQAGTARDRLARERRDAYLRFGQRALKVARDFPTDPVALEALEFVLGTTGGGVEGETGKLRNEALVLVLRDHLCSPDLTSLVHKMSYQYTESAEKALADIAEKSPHRVVRGRAAWQLARELANRSEASRLLRVLPELLDDPELASRKERFQKWQQADPDAAARKAEEWYARVAEQYADVPANDVQKDTLGESAEHGLFALHKLAIGKQASDIDGEDLDGKRFRLSDYRGKVVVLIFCGQWCGPCREMNPQKQKLVECHAGKPFALLEVNSDEDPEAMRRTMRKEKLTWRCWFDGGRNGPFARRWGVHRWPTIFVLDGKGVIRFKELRGPMLDRVVERLVKEAEERR